MKNKWLLLILLFLGSIVLQPAFAKKHHGEVRGVQVASVDAANNKITLTIDHNHQVTTYVVPIGTALTVDGAPTKLGNIEEGMYVISYTEADAATLSQLDVTHHEVK